MAPCRAPAGSYRAKTKGNIERPYRYVRQHFWLAHSFRNLDDLNAQFDEWRVQIANPRVHATTRRVVDEHFAEERPALIAHPDIPYSAVLTIERRVSREGMVSIGGNLYRATLAELIEALGRAEREGRLIEKIRFLGRSSLLIVDEIGYLPITPGGANLFSSSSTPATRKAP
jgi:hypothetical protein